MPANRSHHLGAPREVRGPSSAVAAALVAFLALSLFLVGCEASIP
jgi:hypothetical protein